MSCYPKSLFLGKIFHINRPAIGVPPHFLGKPPFRSSCTCGGQWHDMTWPKNMAVCVISQSSIPRIGDVWIIQNTMYMYMYWVGSYILLYYIYIYVYVIYTIFSILDTKTRWWVVLHLPAGGNGAWPGDLQHGGSCVRCPRGQGTDGAPLEKP